MSKKKNDFLVQGSILAIAGVLVRIIGIIYRIPLTNILGNEGNGYYTAAYDVYSIMLMISSQSIPIAVSKLVSAKVGVGQYKNANRIFMGALGFSSTVGLIVGGITFFFADKLAAFQGYPSASTALKILAPTLVIMSIVGTLRGYFQGLGTMVPTAISQIFEQVINAIVSVAAAYFLYNMGKNIDQINGTTKYSAGYGAAGGTLGTCLGAFTALAFMVFVFFIYKDVNKRKMARDHSRTVMSFENVNKLILVTVIPVLISTTLYNFSNLIDSGIYANIVKFFFDMDEKTRASTWGIYSGRYRLLTTVPIAIASSLASSIVPSMMISLARGERHQILDKIESSIRFTMIIAIPCGVGLTVLGAPILQLLFGRFDMFDQGVSLMYFSLLTVVSFSLSTITNSVLQGIDKLKVPVKHAAISLAIHLVITPIFLIVFKWGIFGVVFADSIFALVVCALNQKVLQESIGYRQEWVNTFIKPFVASLIMGFGAWAVYKLIFLIFPHNAICTFFAIIVAVAIYFVLIIVMKIVDEQSLQNVPKGRSIVKLAKKLHLL